MTNDIKFYLTLFKRRLPVMLLLFLMASIAGVVLSQRLPTMYETSAKLLVEDAQIDSDDRRRPSTQVEASEQLEVIQQRLLTRVNLLDIARETQAIPELNTLTPDEIVIAMREATRVSRSSGRDRATLMTIQFEGDDPRKVAQVVNRYVTIVLATSVDARERTAKERLEFFEVELESLSEDLDEQSAKILAFKTANSDALPEDNNYRQNRRSLLQESRKRAERDLDSAISQRANIERIYQLTGGVDLTPDGPRTIEEQELEELKSRMREFNALSITNPRVKNLQRRIDALTKTVEEAALASNGLTPVNGETQQTSAIDLSLSEYDTRINALRSEIESTTAELAELNDRVERASINSITLAAMEREQENIQNLYSAAVGRLAQARMAERITATANGERITVLEAANVPTTPSSPNRPAVMALGLGAGLGLAAGLFLLLELLNQSIRRPVDVERALEITPLATIPRIESLGRKRLRRFNQIVILLTIVVGVPVALWAIDTYYLPLDLIFEQIQDKLK